MSVCPTLFSLTRIHLTDDRYGFKCRFLGGHIDISDPTSSTEHLSLLQDEDKKVHNAITGREMNYVSADVLKLLRSRKVGHSSRIPVPLKRTFSSALSPSLTVTLRPLVLKQHQRRPKARPVAEKLTKRGT